MAGRVLKEEFSDLLEVLLDSMEFDEIGEDPPRVIGTLKSEDYLTSDVGLVVEFREKKLLLIIQSGD